VGFHLGLSGDKSLLAHTTQLLGNRYGERMRDSEVVASIVAGDPAGLAEAYDKYSGDLYSYCRSLLREPADAADAVQDTFVIAASHVSRLRDPERLRAWLFAVARNECLRQLRARTATAPLDDIADQADASVDVADDAERAETRALILAAAGGLNARELDLIGQLLHGLEIGEAASVLGISRNHAHTLFSRARNHLEASLGALLVGRTGRQDCPDLDALLHNWDGRMTVLVRKRLQRHIDNCEVCSQRRRQALRPALLLALTPATLLSAAAARDAMHVAARAAPSAALRDQVVRLGTGQDPHAVAYRAAAGKNVHSLGLNGFPRQAHLGHLGMLGPKAGLAAGSAIGVAVSATVLVTTLGLPPHPHGTGAGPGHGSTVAAGPASGTPGAAPSASPVADQPGPVPTGSVPTGGTAAPSGSASVPVTSPPAGGPTTGTPTPTSTPPTTAPTSTPAPTVSVSASGPGVSATLSVSPTTVTLSLLLGGTLTLTANGGPVSWSISEPASLVGKLLLSQTSGTLAAGQSATVQLTVSGLASLDTTLTVNPGGQQVTVLLGVA
jgi:RNA polymerase sigma factor (sigma-70 family)